MGTKLSPAGKRINTVIIAAPLVVVTSWILYKRLVLGEEKRVPDGRAIRPLGVRERDERDERDEREQREQREQQQQ
ncbi:hypothetical protein BDF14DRAFT_1800052 [Spinellus fusiger]|nr:hypothetical protein BDF14DRAFT_1800052 [Spinellus fusiger]